MRRRGAFNCGSSPHSRKPSRTASTASAMVTTPRISWGLTRTGCLEQLRLDFGFHSCFGNGVLESWSTGVMAVSENITPTLHHSNTPILSDCRRDQRAGDQIFAPAFEVGILIVDDDSIALPPRVEWNKCDIGQRVIAEEIFPAGHFLVQRR